MRKAKDVAECSRASDGSRLVHPVQIDYPAGTILVGDLYDTSDPSLLTDDMLQASIGGYTVDVSWYPECDPSGHYVATVFRGDWNNVVEILTTNSTRHVKAFVEDVLGDIPGRYSRVRA